MFTVAFFKTQAGNDVVADFLRALPKDDRKVIGEDLKTVQFGFPIGMPLCRSLKNGLHEVRSSVPSKKEVRLVFFVNDKTIIVVHAFIKKTQKTSKEDIEISLKRKRENESNN